MSYIDCLKQKTISFTCIALAWAIVYAIECELEWREEFIVLTPHFIVIIVASAFGYIVLGAFFQQYLKF